jgi:hypothetical protein
LEYLVRTAMSNLKVQRRSWRKVEMLGTRYLQMRVAIGLHWPH